MRLRIPVSVAAALITFFLTPSMLSPVIYNFEGSVADENITLGYCSDEITEVYARSDSCVYASLKDTPDETLADDHILLGKVPPGCNPEVTFEGQANIGMYVKTFTPIDGPAVVPLLSLAVFVFFWVFLEKF